MTICFTPVAPARDRGTDVLVTTNSKRTRPHAVTVLGHQVVGNRSTATSSQLLPQQAPSEIGHHQVDLVSPFQERGERSSRVQCAAGTGDPTMARGWFLVDIECQCRHNEIEDSNIAVDRRPP